MKTVQWVAMLAAVAALALSGTGCKKGGAEGGGAAAAKATKSATAQAKGGEKKAGGDAVAEAENIWKTRCATCHGAEGKGDGPAGAALNPKPRNFHDAKWQKSVTDDRIKKTIVEGGQAVGKSPLMTPNPDLKGKDAVLDALVKKIRSFGGK